MSPVARQKTLPLDKPSGEESLEASTEKGQFWGTDVLGRLMCLPGPNLLVRNNRHHPSLAGSLRPAGPMQLFEYVAKYFRFVLLCFAMRE